MGDLKWPMPNGADQNLRLPNLQNYDTTTAGIVVDKVTGLTWQRTLSTAMYTQAQAAAYCTALPLGGVWRLPSVIELVSIADDTAARFDGSTSTFYPAIDQVAFPITPGENFWTTTPATGVSGQNWTVDFHTGETVFRDVTTPYRVRCVR
jgi:hypothetical protein